MQVFEYDDPDSLGARSHPWSGSLSDSAHRYYDLKRDPALIRLVLEDLREWERYAAVETFYSLLESLNSSDTVAIDRVETNDCAFSGPSRNEHSGVNKALQCSGRLMLLFREQALNTDPYKVHALTQATARALSQEDQDFALGVIGATIVPVRFINLPGEQLGSQLMLSFWAWGDDEQEVMKNLDRTLTGLSSALAVVLQLSLR